MANKERFLSGKRKLAALSGLSTDRHVYLSPEETEPNLGFVGEKTLPIRDEYYQLVTVENGGQYDRYWQVAPSGILTTGLTIFDEGGIVGTGNSISKLDFVGNIVNVTANNFGSIFPAESSFSKPICLSIMSFTLSIGTIIKLIFNFLFYHFYNFFNDFRTWNL